MQRKACRLVLALSVGGVAIFPGTARALSASVRRDSVLQSMMTRPIAAMAREGDGVVKVSSFVALVVGWALAAAVAACGSDGASESPDAAADSGPDKDSAPTKETGVKDSAWEDEAPVELTDEQKADCKLFCRNLNRPTCANSAEALCLRRCRNWMIGLSAHADCQSKYTAWVRCMRRVPDPCERLGNGDYEHSDCDAQRVDVHECVLALFKDDRCEASCDRRPECADKSDRKSCTEACEWDKAKTLVSSPECRRAAMAYWTCTVERQVSKCVGDTLQAQGCEAEYLQISLDCGNELAGVTFH